MSAKLDKVENLRKKDDAVADARGVQPVECTTAPIGFFGVQPERDALCIVLEHWEEIRALARAGCEAQGWCPICACTIGNGEVSHRDDCVLYDERDEE